MLQLISEANNSEVQENAGNKKYEILQKFFSNTSYV